MSRVDPMVKFHGWPVGAFILCTRRIGGGEPLIAVRVVS
jgi:hypothetical protein